MKASKANLWRDDVVIIDRPSGPWTARPLESLTISVPRAGVVTVEDGQGREYVRGRAKGGMTFLVGGSLGRHRITLRSGEGRKIAERFFDVDAETRLKDDSGRYEELLDIFKRTMGLYDPHAGVQSLTYRGRTYMNFVWWILDHYHTLKGMQYFSPHAGGLIELLRATQPDDGMVWSFFQKDTGPGWLDTAYGEYAQHKDGVLCGRQASENHTEYCFVGALYHAWKASGDDRWMRRHLAAARRALDFVMRDRRYWSQRFGLLKRGYTIDSWDFQVRDRYWVEPPVVSYPFYIDADRTKFGVFYGDNTGYVMACNYLAEMLEWSGRDREARIYRKRGEDILERLNALSWNGRFFTHRIEEDPDVVRDLGVDEKSQISFSNAYSLNRGLPHEQCVAILKTYLDLRRHLPDGSPGEWYAIYPPFERGFELQNHPKWQYMNGGVHGHAAGELALGAFEHGYEAYGADILERLRELGRRHGGRVYFAYTGAVEPPPPPQTFMPIDISGVANMDTRDQGVQGVPRWFMERAGNDMRNLPTGGNTFVGVPYKIPDADKNGRRGAIGVSTREGFAETAELPVGRKGGAVYLLHAVGQGGKADVAGVVAMNYADGSRYARYITVGEHVGGWWFPSLQGDYAGVAWSGSNEICARVGVYWAAIENPHPQRAIASLSFTAAADGAIYAVLGVTLADRMPYVPAPPVVPNCGGPDNWAGGCCTHALIKGLAGVDDRETGFRAPCVSPRWTAERVSRVEVTARYAASQGYVAYEYTHDKKKRTIRMLLTGCGDEASVRVLLPKGTCRSGRATVDGKPVETRTEVVETSVYAVASVALRKPCVLTVRYRRPEKKKPAASSAKKRRRT
jgi:hypothetical protein